jgi:hypothetical protein
LFSPQEKEQVQSSEVKLRGFVVLSAGKEETSKLLIIFSIRNEKNVSLRLYFAGFFVSLPS